MERPLPPMPSRIKSLAVDRGYPVPRLLRALRDEARKELWEFYSESDTEEWLQSECQPLGGARAFYLLGTSRTFEVFALIDQLKSGAYILMAKRTIEFHEVVIRFGVRADKVPECADGYPFIQDWLDKKFGREDIADTLDEQPFDSAERRYAVAIIARQGIGGNDMNSLDAENITIEVDGSVMLDEVGGTD